MTDEQKLENVAQQIYLARHNVTNDVDGEELTTFVDDTISWVNQFLPELEKEAYWSWSRNYDANIGTVSLATTRAYDLAATTRTVVKEPERPVRLVLDGAVVSTWDVVYPGMLYNPSATDNPNRVAVIRRKLVFSRDFTGAELGASIIGDTMSYLPRLSRSDTSLLDTVDPIELVYLGVLKNQVLPDIVQGGLTQSFTQKYADLLEGVKMENDTSSQAEDADGESLAYVAGVF